MKDFRAFAIMDGRGKWSVWRRGGEKLGRAEGEERRGFARTFIDVEFAEEDGFNHDERV